jgi:metallo-beta-lactamase family protein
VNTVEGSRALGRLGGGAIIMAGSGMCDAGRIRHHLKNFLGRPETTVLLVGYQAPGTLGHLMAEGTRRVRIQGDEIVVGAHVHKLDDYSGHADQAGLLAWITDRAPIGGALFLTHGEDPAREALAARLKAVGMAESKIRLPVMGETVRLSPSSVRTERIRTRVENGGAAVADWHNRYANAVLRLRERLDALPSDQERQKFLAHVQQEINLS